jgi:hypothetical protein
MNSATITIRGLAELKDQLGRLVPELKGEATKIVTDTAYAAAADIRDQYPLGPGTGPGSKNPHPGGNLKKGVKVSVKEIGPHGVYVQVRSTAPHAWWSEHGHELTKARITKKTKANRGIMFSKKGIPRPVFIPTMIRYRRDMYHKLAEIIRATGLKVELT